MSFQRVNYALLAARLAADDIPESPEGLESVGPPAPEDEDDEEGQESVGPPAPEDEEGSESIPPPDLEDPYPEQFEGVLEPLDAIKYVAKWGRSSNEWVEAAHWKLVLDILGGMRTDKASLDQALEYAANE